MYYNRYVVYIREKYVLRDAPNAAQLRHATQGTDSNRKKALGGFEAAGAERAQIAIRRRRWRLSRPVAGSAQLPNGDAARISTKRTAR